MSVTIDDSDASVQYFEGWVQDDVSGSFDNTLHGSTTAAAAILSFSGEYIDMGYTAYINPAHRRTGTGIEVHGVVEPAGGAQAQSLQFSVDAGVPFNLTSHDLPAGPFTFFSSSNLSPSKTHRLLIFNHDSIESDRPVLWLDFFIINPTLQSHSSDVHSVTPTLQSHPNDMPSALSTLQPHSSVTHSVAPTGTTSESVSSPSPISTITASITGASSSLPPFSSIIPQTSAISISTRVSEVGAPTSTGTASAPSLMASRATHTTPMIIGGSLGGALLIASSAVAAYILRRRRRRRRDGLNGEVWFPEFVSDCSNNCNQLDGMSHDVELYVPDLHRPPAPVMIPPGSPTQTVSTAAGTIHTSAISESTCVPPITPGVLLKQSQVVTCNSSSPPAAYRGAGLTSDAESGTRVVLDPTGETMVQVGEARISRERTSSGVPSDAPPPFPVESDMQPLVFPPEIDRVLSYAPPEVQSGAISLFRSLFQHTMPESVDSAPRAPGTTREVDSGLRLCSDEAAASGYMPPPEYTMR